MKRHIQKVCNLFRAGLVGAICLALPAATWADVSNTATVTFQDAAGATQTGTSNTVTTVVLNKPVITGPATATGNLNVPITQINIVASNSPTSYAQTGLPAGLSLNSTTGAITGTPTAPGIFAVTLTATNAAGTSDPFTLTITILGTPTLALIKEVSPTGIATSGTTLTYTIRYQNTGGGTASNVVIKDVIPVGTTFVTGSIVGGGTLTAGTITWNIGTVAGGAPQQSVSFQVTVN